MSFCSGGDGGVERVGEVKGRRKQERKRKRGVTRGVGAEQGAKDRKHPLRPERGR